jgi:hypothetical protein
MYVLRRIKIYRQASDTSTSMLFYRSSTAGDVTAGLGLNTLGLDSAASTA